MSRPFQRLGIAACSVALFGGGLVAETKPQIVWAVAARLSDEQIQQQLHQLPGWHVNDATLSCAYEFNTFIDSVAFVNRLVEPAEAIGHHPDLKISYNVVEVSLTTHDAGGLTQLDVDLAGEISQIGHDMAANEGCF